MRIMRAAESMKKLLGIRFVLFVSSLFYLGIQMLDDEA